jgi:hypothetical protein
MAYSYSPFESTQNEQGGSIAMAVMNAQYKHPSSAYSQGLKNLIDSMLKAEPSARPDIHQVGYLTCVCEGKHVLTSDVGHRNDKQGSANPVLSILHIHYGTIIYTRTTFIYDTSTFLRVYI